jgi:hypothetical protein
VAVPDDVVTVGQRAAVDAARGGWFGYFLSYDGSVDAYAGALRLCAWVGVAGDHNWADNYDEAVEYFTEEGGWVAAGRPGRARARRRHLVSVRRARRLGPRAR